MKQADINKMYNLSEGIGKKNRQVFYAFCLDKFKDFKPRDWELFLNLINIIPNEIKEDELMWWHIKVHLQGLRHLEMSYTSKVRCDLLMETLEKLQI